MIVGLLAACISGALIGVQNIFNSKVNEHAGSWATTTLVLGMGFLASMCFGLLFEGMDLFTLQNIQPWFWLSGVLGVGVVVNIVNGVKRLGPTYAISIVLTSQLGFALLWDSLGWFGLEQVPFTYKQLLGVLIIVAGILVFKLSSGREKHHVAKAV